MPGESLFPRLEPLLAQVQKPIQYVGGELNSQVKPWADTDVRWALMYPDAYEVGLPNQGVMILYEVLNERDGVLAERTYSVWPDLAGLMRAHGVPAFTVDGHRPVRDFDVLGVSFSTELGYTNLLEHLDLAGIPLHAADRTDGDPIVLAGGHAAFNPEPVARFIDAAVLGDGEQAVLEMTEVLRQAKREGASREEVLLRLARTGGVYVPASYDVSYLPDGRIARVAPNRTDVPFRVEKRTVMDLDAWPYPKTPLVPLAETVHGRRSGLTFAPEGGSERLRKVINKTVSKQDLVDTVVAAYSAGWRQVKLYFMCGLPTETDEDVLEIADMARDVIRAGRAATGSRDLRCTVSIGGFVPKPHTPFQWAAQLDHESTDRRLKLLRDAINGDRDLGRAIGFRYHDGKPGIVEGLLSRGDRRVGDVLEQVWRDGGVFDGWSEHFSFERWMRAADAVGVDVDWYTTRERDEAEVLPWDHLDVGLDREWLWADWQDALDEQELDDCRWTPCFDCGVCPTMGTEIQVGPTGRTLLPLSVAPSA